MSTSLDLARTYTSYSGVDIRVIINGAQVGSMQALSYAIQREKAPIYVMGSVDPVSYSRGKRGIAGTMISLMLDTHLLMSPSFTGEHYLGDTDELFAKINNDKAATAAGASAATSNLSSGPVAALNAGIAAANAVGRAGNTSVLQDANNDVDTPVSLVNLNGAQLGGGLVSFSGTAGTAGATASGPYQRMTREVQYDVNNLTNNYRVSPVFYVDQILPFDIAIVAANEYGQSAQMRLYGCEILNEGSGFSIDDVVIENQMTYVCRTILPWRSFDLGVRDSLYSKVGNEENRGARLTSGTATPISNNVK